MDTLHNTKWITRTAVILALGITVQMFRLPQPVTGPAVNALLLLSVILVGPGSGVLIGCLTPLIAWMVGIMGFAPMVPFVMLGNFALVLVFAFFREKTREEAYQFIINLRSAAAMVAAAVAKFAVFYLAVNYALKWMHFALPGPVATAFGVVQLYTALAGGALALILGKYLSNLLARTNSA